jgi:hypothetical protein
MCDGGISITPPRLVPDVEIANGREIADFSRPA